MVVAIICLVSTVGHNSVSANVQEMNSEDELAEQALTSFEARFVEKT
jgi:hypothetical protein